MSLSDYQKEINAINDRLNGISVPSASSTDISLSVMGYFIFGFVVLLVVLLILLLRSHGSTSSAVG
jgi:hypothetical protein